MNKPLERLYRSHLWLTSHQRSTLFLLDTGTPGTNKWRKGEVQGALSHLIYRGPSKTPNFTPNVLSSFCQKTNEYKKGYKFLIIGTRFFKNVWKLSSLITFSSVATQNYQAFKIFYVYPKVPNSARKFDHKILDGCPWNVYCQGSFSREGWCC